MAGLCLPGLKACHYSDVPTVMSGWGKKGLTSPSASPYSVGHQTGHCKLQCSIFLQSESSPARPLSTGLVSYGFHQVSLVVRPQVSQLLAHSLQVRASQPGPVDWGWGWGAEFLTGASPVYLLGYLAQSMASPTTGCPLPGHTHKGLFHQKPSSATCWAGQAKALEQAAGVALGSQTLCSLLP